MGEISFSLMGFYLREVSYFILKRQVGIFWVHLTLGTLAVSRLPSKAMPRRKEGGIR